MTINYCNVSERYRDLIDAADSIVNMRKCALSIQEELHHMQDSCDVHGLKRSVRTQVNEDKDTKGSVKSLNFGFLLCLICL